MAQQPVVGQGLLIVEVLRSLSDTPHSAGHLWTSERPDAENSTWEHTKLTSDWHSYPWQDCNPQSQLASGRKSTP
jgi:hypothetical protein